MLAAVIDTSVLFSGLQRDFLLSLSAEGAFRCVLSEDILFEIEYIKRLKLLRQGRTEREATQRAAHLVAQLRPVFDIEPRSRLELVSRSGLPDPGDESVLAAAVISGADIIVTETPYDFPESLLPTNITTARPVNFIHEVVSANPMTAWSALSSVSSRRSSPPRDERSVLDLLARRQHVALHTVALLKNHTQ